MISRSIYNLKIDTSCMCDISFDRSILQLSNGIRHVMPSTDRKLGLTAKASMAQPVSQPAVCSNGLIRGLSCPSVYCHTKYLKHITSFMLCDQTVSSLNLLLHNNTSSNQSCPLQHSFQGTSHSQSSNHVVIQKIY
jgi:hypothetical protein